jgi:microcin C transport system substrate-binding protein
MVGLGVLGLLITLGAAKWAKADETDMIVSHGYSFYGELSYPADFTHFNYVNPNAPKGGEIALNFVGTLDSMNPYSGKGRAHLFSIYHYETLLGEAASRIGMPADVYGESYCLLCERLEYPKDKSWVIFHMRKDATFSNGDPVTAHDVLFSHNIFLEQGLKSYAEAVRKRIPDAEVLDDYTIKFYFADDLESRRSLIDQVGGVPVFRKAWFDEQKETLAGTWLAVGPPEGSGPYMVDSFDLTKRIVLKRNPDYWGWDHPVNQGRHNFDTIRLEIFGDDTASFEGFKAGEYTMRTEGDPKKWASQYKDIPKVKSGQIIMEELPDGQPPTAAGIIFNLTQTENKNPSRKALEDVRVREALSLAFNFEWTNNSLLYDLYQQRASYSDGTEIMATGKPEGLELELLTSLGDLVPAEMLENEARLPHTSKGERLSDRRNLRKAGKLLEEAGWTVGDDGIRRNADGETFSLEYLFLATSTQTSRASAESFVENVKAMGIEIKLDLVDPAQYTNRERERDYDLVSDSYPAFLGTGTGLMQRLGAETAAFSLFNPAGIASPLVDAVIDGSLKAESRAEEVAWLKALDRTLRHEFIMIPTWYKPNHWVASYNQYEHPEEIAPFGLGHLDYWWYNAEKGAALQAAGALR